MQQDRRSRWDSDQGGSSPLSGRNMIKGGSGGVREGPEAGYVLPSHPIDTSGGVFYEEGGKRRAAPGNSAGKPDTHLGGGVARYFSPLGFYNFVHCFFL
mmetsp:Transcript_61068/g.105218  ORF Transcript_61068/g.105218 Transcript_61068/m.105218 type:complete len:99 (+) Transcript_61068:761-1057(+)